MARIRAGSTDLYRYLWRSALQFDGVTELSRRLTSAGFEDIRVQTVPGWQQHIVHTFRGRRPPDPASGAAAPTEAEVDAEAATPAEGIDLTKPPS